MSGRSAREKHPGSDRDTNQKLLTENDKRLYHTPTEAGTILQLSIINQTVIIANVYAMTVALPPVAEVKGLTYIISVSSSIAAVTLTDYPNTSYSDSVDWEGDYTLDAADDSITLRSTGSSWTVVSNDIS